MRRWRPARASARRKRDRSSYPSRRERSPTDAAPITSSWPSIAFTPDEFGSGPDDGNSVERPFLVDVDVLIRPFGAGPALYGLDNAAGERVNAEAIFRVCAVGRGRALGR